jgi:excisionase family DNA binding protein
MVEKLTLSVEEAAEMLGVCTKTLYTMTHMEGFPTIKIGRRTRISYEGLREWVRKQENNVVEVRA